MSVKLEGNNDSNFILCNTQESPMNTLHIVFLYLQHPPTLQKEFSEFILISVTYNQKRYLRVTWEDDA